ncbi:MAG: TetR/AcrR family transcriptional regulator [Polyangiales bacterium]
MPRPKKTSYHHGHLREALLTAALELLRERGPAAISLREVARRAGVSHAAPAHHFGDKAGLLTALATEGFVRFAESQRAGAERGGDDPVVRFAWTGWAYVMFAVEHRAYFELMFRPELLRQDDPAFAHASRVAYDGLLEVVRAALGGDPAPDALALRATTAWALAHGLATLWLDGNLGTYAQQSDLDTLARSVFGLPQRASRNADPPTRKPRPR